MSAKRLPPVPIVALDYPALDEALALVDELGPLCRFYKIGSELFTAAGPEAVARVRGAGCEVMLDLKFHDIPHTVAGAVASARALGVRIITVHATGGEAMLRAAVGAAGGVCELFAVTVLTSMDGPTISGIWGRDPVEVGQEVVRLAAMARAAGVSGVVASGFDVEAIKGALAPGFKVLVPGIRLAGADPGDQARVVTPANAAKLGANYIILGRLVTQAGDPRAALQQVADEMAGFRAS